MSLITPNASARRRALSASAPVFAALGDETRLRLLDRLSARGPMSTARLTEGTHITRQAVTKHLRQLEDAGLVRSSRHGREQLWQPNARALDEAREYLDVISRGWDDALARLKQFVEE